MSNSKLNANADSFEPVLDVINRLLSDDNFRLPNIIPNSDYKINPFDDDIGSQPYIAFIMPMCSGKTYFSKKYGLMDIDRTRNKEFEAKIKPMLAKAIETGKWNEHNKFWFDHTIKWFKENCRKYNLSVIFTHSIDHALALRSKYIIPLKLKQSAWNLNLKERKLKLKTEDEIKQFEFLTRTNWESVKGTIYSSREDIEKAIVKTIELIIPDIYKETIAIGKPMNKFKD